MNICVTIILGKKIPKSYNYFWSLTNNSDGSNA